LNTYDQNNQAILSTKEPEYWDLENNALKPIRDFIKNEIGI